MSEFHATIHIPRLITKSHAIRSVDANANANAERMAKRKGWAGEQRSAAHLENDVPVGGDGEHVASARPERIHHPAVGVRVAIDGLDARHQSSCVQKSSRYSSVVTVR